MRSAAAVLFGCVGSRSEEVVDDGDIILQSYKYVNAQNIRNTTHNILASYQIIFLDFIYRIVKYDHKFRRLCLEVSKAPAEFHRVPQICKSDL